MTSPLTLDQAVIVSGYTGVLICPFDKLHREIEQRLGHPVWTHQLPDLMESHIKPAFKDDFLALAPAEEV
jgi:hypothetical protein